MTFQNLYQYSKSQAHQDIFALLANNFKIGGYFIDLGSNEPIVCNNTYILESIFSWNGLLVDFVPFLVEQCRQQRKAKALQADLNLISPTSLLDDYFSPQIIDYLSLDLDNDATEIALKNFNFQKYHVRCLTFEHDSYLRGDNLKNLSREILSKVGMRLVCSDVKFNGSTFEDWYVDSEIFESSEYINKIICDKKEHSEIFLPLL